MTLEGRLADPDRTLASDPRSDPRMVAVLEPLGLGDPPPDPPFTATSSLADLLLLCAEVETEFQGLFGALVEGLPPVSGATSETMTIDGADDNEIALHVHRPENPAEPAPCVVHLHGGGMVLLQATDPVFVRWRDELAASGLVAVGVEFRNGGGKIGCHPYPAGLEDCASAVRWAASHLSELGASHVVVSGESGGGNLSLAVTLKARREGWIDEIAGVYAQCPYISNAWVDMPGDLPSLRENDGYFISCALLSILAAVYDPGSANADDPTCWPARAGADDLRGLPPHVISVNELDPLRDEGIAHHRALSEAGVQARLRVVAGTCHAADVFLAGAMPDVHAESLRDIAEFARSVA